MKNQVQSRNLFLRATAILFLALSLCVPATMATTPAGEATPQPIQVESDVVAPVTIHAPSPQYTRPARRAGVGGVVVVRATIDKNGDVTDTELIETLPMGLGDAAVKAVEEWKFEPATLHGEPVDVTYDLTVNFKVFSPARPANRSSAP